MLQNYKLRHSIKNYNGQYLNAILSFVSASDGKTGLYYLLIYYQYKILVYNEHWEYQRNLTVSDYPNYLLYANNSTYISIGLGVIRKYDKYLNEYIQINRTGYYRGFYFNATNGFIYAANSNNQISIFDQNLTFVRSLSTFFSPHIITDYNGMLVVTDYYSGNISFYQDSVLIQTISTYCQGRVNSILFDDYNHMMLLCIEPSIIYIYHTNGTYIGIGFQTSDCLPRCMNFDSNDRLIITCTNNIGIYY